LLALATQLKTGVGATALMIVGFVTVYLNPAMPSPTTPGVLVLTARQRFPGTVHWRIFVALGVDPARAVEALRSMGKRPQRTEPGTVGRRTRILGFAAAFGSQAIAVASAASGQIGVLLRRHCTCGLSEAKGIASVLFVSAQGRGGHP
jgi:hypothetical protein